MAGQKMKDFESRDRQTADADSPHIVGAACRLPGANSLDEAWKVLIGQGCTIETVQTQNYNPDLYLGSGSGANKNTTGRSYSIQSGQLDKAYHFDAGFFGISPREAAEMDPQQRLMIQTVWEAVENSGLNIKDLAGDRTGVFVGSSLVENQSLYYLDSARGGGHFSLGNTLCIIANRVSSTFDFRGPSIVLDAACAASLYAFHQASEAIRRGELDTAIVGGVHILRTPGGFVGFSQARMLSPTGRCRAFDESADGYVRSEGSVAVVLQSPETARRMHARTRARVLATGVNSDGHTSTLTVPSAKAQERLIDQVLEQTGRDPDDFVYYEAHGTGTQVGDPIEASSIGGAVARLRTEPLPIGSAKTNFGHPEPVAGLMGLAKTLLIIENEMIPPSLHFETPNPNIDFEDLNLSVVTEATPTGDLRDKIIGLNSFGFGGTNASAIIAAPDDAGVGAQADAESVVHDAPESPWLLLSAASEKSLRDLSAKWADQLSQETLETQCVLAAASAKARVEMTNRLALRVNGDTADRLRQFSDGAEVADILTGTTPQTAGRTIFVFPGNGAQFQGLGRIEYDNDPEFQAEFDRIADAFIAEGISDIRGHLTSETLADDLLSPLVAQPFLLGYQIAKARSLMASGIRPDVTVGHSIGEIAALHIAGAYDLSDAVHIVASRSRAFEDLRGKGGMAVVAASEEDVAQAMSGLGEPLLAIAAVNGNRSVTVSGPEAAIERLSRVTINGKRLPMVRLKIEIPYHSAQLDDLQDRFLSDLAQVTFHDPIIDYASTTFGRMMRKGECNAEYLWQNARQTVRFADAMTALLEEGPCQIVEVADTAQVKNNIRDLARLNGYAIDQFVPKVSQFDDGTVEGADQIAARAWTRGFAVDAGKLTGRFEGQTPPLPTYPWDLEVHHAPLSADGLDGWGEVGRRMLSGRRPERASTVWSSEFTPTQPAWVKDHVVGGRAILPAAAFIEIVLAAATEIWDDQPVELKDFDLLVPISIDGHGVRIIADIDPDTGRVFLKFRQRLVDEKWTVFARGTVRLCQYSGPAKAPARAANGQTQTGEALYEALADSGLEYGPSFRRASSCTLIGEERASVSLSDTILKGRFALDPSSTDAAFHGIAAVLRDIGQSRTNKKVPASHRAFRTAMEAGATALPSRIGQLKLWQPGAPVVSADVALVKIRARSIAADLVLRSASGEAVAEISGAEFTLVNLGKRSRLHPARTQIVQKRLRRQGVPVSLPSGWATPKAVLTRLGYSKTPTTDDLQTALTSIKTLKAKKDRAEQADQIESVLGMAPMLADDIRVLLAGLRGERLRDVEANSAMHRALWLRCEELLTELARKWPLAERMNVLVRGVPNARVVEKLETLEAVDRFAVAPGADDLPEDLRQALPPHLAPLIELEPEAGAFDIVVDLTRGRLDMIVPEALASGGLLVGLDVPVLTLGGDDCDDAAWFSDAAPLPIRLRTDRQTAQADTQSGAAVKPNLLPASTAQDHPQLARWTAQAEGEAASHNVLALHHNRGDDVASLLANVIFTLRWATEETQLPLVIVATGAQDDPDFAIWRSGLASLVRTVANEAPDAKMRLISVSDDMALLTDAEWAELFQNSEREPCQHLCQNGLFALRVKRLAEPRATGPQDLVVKEPGRLQSVTWEPSPKRRLKSDEVEISVQATGLNFRDVMWARGILPDRIIEAGVSGAALGMECAGVVTKAGANATVAVGTRVAAFVKQGFRSKANLPSAGVFALPDNVSFDAAASIPVAFGTAWDALVNVGRIREGDRVLIHGGAGGVGLAAIQIARLHGAEVFATAGTPEKRAIAKAYGAQHIYNSRDLLFEEAIKSQTKGRGVDLVLNSLAGEAMQRSVDCLAPFGRFVELGKRDYLEGSLLDLRPFAANLAYFGYDLDQRLAEDPQGVSETLSKVFAALKAGDLKVLPTTVFEAEEAARAFSHMLTSRHVGKIVIRPPKGSVNKTGKPIRDSWVVLGGTGGVGLALAEALRAKGASEVHLVSRSGDMSMLPKDQTEWLAGDEHVHVAKLDATQDAELDALLSGILAKGGRIGGVVHAAMTLKDRPLRDIDIVEVEQVLRSKIAVGMALDRVLRSFAQQPDHVVFFSSIAAQLGNPGQIAYSAANCALEQLAAERTADGFATHAIGWGPIADRGYLLRNAKVMAQFQHMDGLNLLSIDEVIEEFFETVSRSSQSRHCYASTEWGQLAPILPGLRAMAFKTLVAAGAEDSVLDGALLETLRSSSWSKAQGIVEQAMREMLATIMHLAPEDIDLHQPLAQYGIDSLMAMELQMEVGRVFGDNVSLYSLNEKMTAARLGAQILEKIKSEGNEDA